MINSQATQRIKIEEINLLVHIYGNIIIRFFRPRIMSKGSKFKFAKMHLSVVREQVANSCPSVKYVFAKK